MDTRAARLGEAGPLRLRGLGTILDRQRGHLFGWSPVAFGIGAASYFALTIEPDWQVTLLTCALLVGICGLFALRYTISPLIWGLVLVAMGFSMAASRANFVEAPVLGFRYYGPIEGRIVKIDRSQSDKPRLTLDRVVLDNIEPSRTPTRVRVSLHGDQPFLKPEPGMVVMMTGHLSPPSGPVEPGGFDFQRKSWFEGLGAVGYTRVPALLYEPAKDRSFALQITRLRQVMSSAIKDRMGPREGPFAAAIITGDRSDIDPVALEALRASNLAHLLAISGMHMGMLTGVVFLLARGGLALVPQVALRWHPKRFAAITALIVAMLYLLISGASVATQRAFVMVAVMLVALCLDRRAISLRSVAIAALIVLLVSPESITGPGFQMSFAATTALVAVFAYLRDKDWMYRWPKWTRGFTSLVLSSAIAGLATAPFGAAHFNQIAHYGLLANLLSVPIMGIVVMPGAVMAAALAPFGFEALGLWVMGWGVWWILFVAETVAGLGGSLSKVPGPDWWVLPLLSFGGLILCLWQGIGRLTGVAVIGLAAIGWSLSERPAILISETGRLIGVMTLEGRALNKPKGDGFSSEVWLENDGDTVTQEEAASRQPYERDFVRLSYLGTNIIFDATKDIPPDQMARYCRTARVIIAARYEGRAPCRIHTADSLLRSGALAIDDHKGQVRVTSTLDYRGARLWSGTDQ